MLGATITLLHNARISGANTPGSRTASTPKKACEHTKGSVYIAKVMYVAKGKYIENTKDSVYAAESKHSEYAVRHVYS